MIETIILTIIIIIIIVIIIIMMAGQELDGAYFGTSFPQIFLQSYPSLAPAAATATTVILYYYYCYNYYDILM